MTDETQETGPEEDGGTKMDAVLRVLSQLLEVVRTNGEKLDLLVQDATEEKPPSPIVTVLSELVEGVNEQSRLLAELPGEIVRALDGTEDQDNPDGEAHTPNDWPEE